MLKNSGELVEEIGEVPPTSGAKRINLKEALTVEISVIEESTFFIIPLPNGGAAIFDLLIEGPHTIRFEQA